MVIAGNSGFDGLLKLAKQPDGSRTLDIVMAHGMCTHKSDWAADSINSMMEILESPQPRLSKDTTAETIPGTEIEMIRADVTGGGANFRVSALIWSPLTTKLKTQLLYDRTGDSSTDCTTSKECKPKRVKVNALIKDRLVSDCFADALIYEGQSKEEILRQMRIALAYATASNLDTKSLLALDVQKATDQANLASARADGPLAVITDSLGSKVLFDALDVQSDKDVDAARARARARARTRTRQRIGLVFMRANQLPLLSLADPARKGGDPVKLLSYEESSVPGAVKFQRTVVAFSDPNDLLSYPLRGSSYQSPQWANVKLVDVLVSNGPSWLGLFENPLTAHTAYEKNPDVTRLMLYGSEKEGGKP